MEQIKRQVSRARRRLVMEQFLGIFGWCLFAALMVAVIALAVPKIWPIAFAGQTWNIAWVGGAVAAGLVATGVLTMVSRKGEMDAAIELDRRFGLRERVSSSLSLAPGEQESEAGQALVSDAERRVGRIEVGEQFRIKPGFRPLLPLLPALVVFGLFLVKDAVQDEVSAASTVDVEARNRVKSAVENMKERLDKKQKEAAENGLKEAEELMKQVSDGLNSIKSDEKLDRQKALVKLSELTKELAKRQEQLGGTEKLRKDLQALKNLEKGPADRITEAIKDGDFKKAMEAMKSLQEKLQKGELSEKQQQDLAKQMEQMQNKLQQMVDAHQKKKESLKEQVEEAMKNGDLSKAGQLQQQLDQLNQQNEQMAQLGEMAQKMNEAAQQLQQGNQQQAAQQMQQLAQDLQKMESQLGELEMIDAAMQEIADCKNAMCEGGDGDLGFDMAMGMGGQGQGDQPGQGMGEGEGRGDRPEERGDTSSYKSRVAQNVQKGEVVRAGFANGPNLAGQSQEAVKEEILGAKPETADAVENVRLPRAEREHSKEYFQGFVEE